MSDQPIKYQFKIYDKTPDNGGMVLRHYSTKSTRKFIQRLKLIKNQELTYLRVIYNQGGHNDGFYSNKKDLMFAFKAFNEK